MPEPKICPDCPLRSYMKTVKTQTYTTTESEQSIVNICSKLRALATAWRWPGCPHYPPTETIEAYLCVEKRKENSGRK